MSHGFARQLFIVNDFDDWKQLMSGRLSLTSNTPITTSEVTAATTLYYTPYIGETVSVYNTGSQVWEPYTLSEISVSVPSTTDTNFDVFLYVSSGTLTLETVDWTNDTTRATALAQQDEIYVKSGDSSRRYLGTCRTTSVSGQCEDSHTKRFVWNYYNRVPRKLTVFETTASWTYGSTTYRSTNNSTSNRVEIVLGVAEEEINILSTGVFQGNSASTDGWGSGIAEDATNTNDAVAGDGLSFPLFTSGTSGDGGMSFSQLIKYPTVGYHFYQWTENAGIGSVIVYGRSGVDREVGLLGHING